MADMKTVEEVRRERLAMLVEEFGSLANLNERLGYVRRDSTLSQYLNSSKGSRTDKPKVMGSPVARRLEAACKKNAGWMDTDPDLLLDISEEARQLASAFDGLPEEDRASFRKICGPFLSLAVASSQASEQPTKEDEQNFRALDSPPVRRRRKPAA